MSSIKKALKKTWIGKLAKRLLRKPPEYQDFPGSKNYWEERYQADDNSGSGSYGRLAEFKAEIINEFVAKNNIKTVIEFGSGDGNQLTLANYPNYKGFDVSTKAIELCKAKFKDDPTKAFYSMEDEDQLNTRADLVLSLDVLYHLIEDKVFDSYMRRLFNSASKYVIIYSSNYNDHFAAHVKCRKFTDWVEKNIETNWELTKCLKNKYPFDKNDPDNTSMADFYFYEKL